MGWVKNLEEAIVAFLAPRKMLFGNMTMILSIVMILVGLPAQIYENYCAEECKISIVLVSLVLLAYTARIPYMASVRAWKAVPADVLGFIFSVIIVGQYFYY